ncbi:alkaline phosphatase family protein [Anditalea andensis]|uniref:Nucleotide pyrophosphatase n=1 Tax=Anditalea andensis TaxID=1048983 RepID=A0A074KWW8_9BACT|nr:alkaline phosphatase family protein [Anditalea andensis]KEO72700.1 nucleotide pyrophosphatase [Anditalea andensis]
MGKIFLMGIIGLIINSMVLAQEKPKKAVFIILDGISYDVIQQVETPHIDRIAAAGGFSKAYVGGGRGSYSETPTISAVGYNSLLTGTWVNKHNVFDNDIQRPNYNYWTVFRYLKEAMPSAHLAIFSTWLDNRTKLIGEGMAATGNYFLDYSYDGFELDTILYPHDPEKKYISEIDEKVSKEASRYILENGPDLSWVYLEYPDDMGHRFGDGSELYDAVKEADRQTGKIYDSVLERIDRGEDWLVIVTTDHGRQPDTGLHHGGQSDRERDIWISTNANGLNDYFKNQQVAIVDILPTLLRHFQISVPEENINEIDGVSLIDSISVYHPKIEKNDNEIIFKWAFMGEETEDIEIWGAYTNKFRQTGEEDKYHLFGKVKGSKGTYSIPISNLQKEQVKILFKGKRNTVNKWIVNKK